jgi:N-terminal domain of (some) glycogen debranching enzymes/short chain dehydrogenase
VTNRARRSVTCELAWSLAADFADIQEAQAGRREQDGPVRLSAAPHSISLTYQHPELPFSFAMTNLCSEVAHEHSTPSASRAGDGDHRASSGIGLVTVRQAALRAPVPSSSRPSGDHGRATPSRTGRCVDQRWERALRSRPLQANYCAAKHALKAFTDTLRMELEEESVPISVTLVKPASIDI